jgi:hypothetical protein
MFPSARLVAVTVSFVDVVTEGAVNRPPVEIVPALACQVTAVLLVEVKAAENCCLPPDEIVAVAGERLMAILFCGTTVTSETATLVESATPVAITVSLVEDVTVGAVNRPLCEIVPALACQKIAEERIPVLPVDVPGDNSVAENCCWAPEEIVTADGETLTFAFEGVEALDGCAPDAEIPAQPMFRHIKVERRIAVPSCQM